MLGCGFAQLISQFGDRLNQMALIGLIAERSTGSVSDLAKVLAFTIIPVFIVGPIAGAYVDRWDRKRTLFVCDLVRGLLVLTIPFIFIYWKAIWPIYTVVFLMFCFSRFYVPAKMSIIPEIVHEDNLLTANSLITTTGMIAFVLGCILGGYAVEWFGARGGFIGDALTFFVSAALIFSMARNFHVNLEKENVLSKGREILEIEKSIWADMKEGFFYLVKQKEIRFVMNMFFLLLAAAGAVYVVIIVFVQQAFGSVTKHLGVLAVCLGVGLFAGSIAYGKWGKKFKWYQTIFFCLILGGIMMGLFSLVINQWANVWAAGTLSIILGAVLGPIFIASNTVVHFVADKNMQGKVFTAMEMVIHFAFLVAMLFTAFLSDKLKIPCVYILLGVSVVFISFGVAGLLQSKKFAHLFKQS